MNLLMTSTAAKLMENILCECDNYKATYEFLNQDCFTLSYDVRGPQKDYVIETKFTRIQNVESQGSHESHDNHS